MNEIKIRAYDKRTKQIAELLGFKYVGKTQIQLFYLDEDGCSTSCTCDKEFIVLMQYTGLKDKNGKEIYEGNIIHRDGYWNSYCVWDEKTVQFRFIATDWVVTQGKPHYIDQYELEKYEISGTIFDNPELLQEVSNE